MVWMVKINLGMGGLLSGASLQSDKWACILDLSCDLSCLVSFVQIELPLAKVIFAETSIMSLLCVMILISHSAMLCSLITVLESPGIAVTGSPSILKGYHNSLINGSPSIQEVDLFMAHLV